MLRVESALPFLAVWLNQGEIIDNPPTEKKILNKIGINFFFQNVSLGWQESKDYIQTKNEMKLGMQILSRFKSSLHPGGICPNWTDLTSFDSVIGQKKWETKPVAFLRRGV